MNKSRPIRGSPELWLTPLIGLVLLGLLIWHWRMRLMTGSFADGWHLSLRGNIALDILIGAAPLFATACVQRLFRAWTWPGWVQGLAAGIIGAMVIGTFYYYALYPLAHWAQPRDEGQGNDIAMYADDILGLAIVAGLAVFASAFAISALMRRQRASLTVD